MPSRFISATTSSPKSVSPPAQRRQLVLDDVAAFDAHHAGQLAGGHGPADLGHAAGQRHAVGVAPHHLVDRVDAFQGLADRAAVALALAHVDRPELHVEPALGDARQVHVALVVALCEAPLGVLEPGRGVRVRVHDDRPVVQLQGVGRAARGERADQRDPDRPGPGHGLPPRAWFRGIMPPLRRQERS
jgi:hypothetical protein